jgi:hypothetical protein
LSGDEGIRVRYEQEIKDKGFQATDCVRNTALFQLELGADTGQIKDIKLSGDMAGTPQLIARAFEAKIDLYKQMGDICGMLIVPHEGVDYGALAAGMPKITAQMEYIDKSIFEASPLVFALLISDTPDKDGHASRLIITKQERNDLVMLIDGSFKDVDAKNSRDVVAAASVIKSYLTKKGYTPADEALK